MLFYNIKNTSFHDYRLFIHPTLLCFLLPNFYIPKAGFFASQCLNIVLFSRMTKQSDTSETEEYVLELAA